VKAAHDVDLRRQSSVGSPGLLESIDIAGGKQERSRTEAVSRGCKGGVPWATEPFTPRVWSSQEGDKREEERRVSWFDLQGPGKTCLFSHPWGFRAPFGGKKIPFAQALQPRPAFADAFFWLETKKGREQGKREAACRRENDQSNRGEETALRRRENRVGFRPYISEEVRGGLTVGAAE